MTGTLSRLQPETSNRGRREATPAPAGEPVALLSIGADLLPRQAGTGRGGRGRRLVALGVVVAAVVAVAGAWLLAGGARSSAESALADAQDRQRSLQVQSRTYDDLVRTTTQATALRTALAQVMATDAPWSTVLDDLARVRGGVSFTSVDGAVDEPAQAASGTDAPVTTPGAFAHLDVSGSAADKPTIAAFVESLGSIDGFADPFLSSVTASSGSSNGGAYSFTVSVALTGDLRSAAAGRWATTSGGGK